MSGGGGGGIIIHAAANHPRATPAEKATLLAIADRSPIVCSWLDAWRVARIIRRLLHRA